MIPTVHSREPLPYRGRFAPTPSGPLHLGSLMTAVASFLDARHAGGRWLLRIDDLDVPRCMPGADSIILRQLESHGLHWDETPRYESRYRPAYEAALKYLAEGGHLYACRCTRAELASRSRVGPDGPVYDGHCRELALPFEDGALRYRLPAGDLELDDQIQGRLRRRPSEDVGDFVVRRRDGILGYHLACAIDEQAQGITRVVRGADLIGSSFCQLSLMRNLHQTSPEYAHLPVLVDQQGGKLSKQNRAAPVEERQASENLWRCLFWLNQAPPDTLRTAPPGELLAWAVPHWLLTAVPRVKTRLLETPP